MSIKIVTDSTSYIPKRLIDKYNISLISLNIIYENKTYREMDMNWSDFYNKMIGSKTLPTSSQPALNEIYECFENIIKDNNSLVGIFISSDMSGTYSSANLAKDMILEKYPEARIEILDSRSNCMQLGYAAIYAAKTALAGGTMEDVIKSANSIILRSRFLFVPDTLVYLKKGGRIGGASALLGMLLQIIPVLTVVDGKTNVFTKVRTKKSAIEMIIETLMQDIQKNGLSEIIVHHIDSEDEALELAEKLKNKLGVTVEICPIGPVIGVHVGPKTIGIVYCTEKE
jgi:DegV family protein with EDD domain